MIRLIIRPTITIPAIGESLKSFTGFFGPMAFHAEAAEWARHFGQLEDDMDGLLAEMLGVPRGDIDKWINPGRYVTGREMAKAGLAELIDLRGYIDATNNGQPTQGKRKRSQQAVE